LKDQPLFKTTGMFAAHSRTSYFKRALFFSFLAGLLLSTPKKEKLRKWTLAAYEVHYVRSNATYPDMREDEKELTERMLRKYDQWAFYSDGTFELVSGPEPRHYPPVRGSYATKDHLIIFNATQHRNTAAGRYALSVEGVCDSRSGLLNMRKEVKPLDSVFAEQSAGTHYSFVTVKVAMQPAESVRQPYGLN
jgi:hypothetical protein